MFSRPVSRRSFLARTGGAGLAALGGAALLDACAPALAGRTTSPLPRPNNPVTWPVFAADAKNGPRRLIKGLTSRLLARPIR